jgi:hypothetical protein
MEITLKITVNTDGATDEQTRNLPEEVRTLVENYLDHLLNAPRVEIVRMEA